MQTKFWSYIQLMRLDKPVGIYLVLWPALWALWLAAEGTPPGLVLVVFILGAIVMRSAGCVINDYADRHWDGDVARTASRPLATGAITPRDALLLFAGLCLVGFGLVLLLNPLTILLSLGALVLATLYPFTKRYTHWPQMFLGAAFAWAVPMGYAAVLGSVPYQAWLVFAITLIWTLIYDTFYAITDRDDDLKVGIKSTAILFGRYDLVIIGLLQSLMVLLLVVLGYWLQLGMAFWISLAVVVALFSSQLWQSRHRDPQACFKAFKQNHWVGLVILIGLIIDLA
ncbi:4-hydroxybenzoate octaprenyltransferase [Thiomicrospira cyclica]|uniref:4-hydroxybenzoate octaprenyltransferase n=1 Tax=Thiomicrospira cyclica (strain DSM 14477 / JCM 11371 / ALM1) TaxID=717773 RepID=F6DB27_THICA|nr:4-hydroxybenzoate octaprenyltransferase [Thiomicrospira cyclica]AEG32360.1 4-hydroxybenzoate octaprenyltransferase [Thiomicrospira cyclica ALM1]